MRNNKLAEDYIKRAGKRLLALEVLFNVESWADVVRESQEIVELCLKALLRISDIEAPRTHDVSGVLAAERERIPEPASASIDFLIEASKKLRRDRELAFYGSEDLTPSEFYSRSDAKEALELARKTHAIISEGV